MEVIKCEDCTFHRDYIVALLKGGIEMHEDVCLRMKREVPKDFFCGYAEKKTELL